jgi:hypothetical protein
MLCAGLSAILSQDIHELVIALVVHVPGHRAQDLDEAWVQQEGGQRGVPPLHSAAVELLMLLELKLLEPEATSPFSPPPPYPWHWLGDEGSWYTSASAGGLYI